MRARRLAPALVLLIALAPVGCGAGDEHSPRGSKRQGPLDAGDATAAAAYVPAGKAVTWGYATLGNLGDEEIVLERIEVAGVPPQLEVLTVQVSPPSRPESIGIGRYPVTHIPTLAVKGAVVPPDGTRGAERGVEVLVGIRSNAKGRWTTGGLRVRYRTGSDLFEETFDQVVALCDDRQACPRS